MNVSLLSRWGRVARIGLVLFAAALTGCASTLSARVTSFQQWPAGVDGQTYRFAETGPAQANNLEYRAYQDMVRSGVGATGLVEAARGAPARFVVSFDFGAQQTQVMTRRPYDPYFYGPPGFYGHRWGYGGYGGFWGPEWIDVPVVAYRNFLNLQIRDSQQGNTEVYRSSAVTVSDEPDVINTMPYLVRAIFDNFPGNNGSERVIKYQTDR